MSTIFSDHCEEGYSDYAKYASVIHSTLLKSRWLYYKSLLASLIQKENKSICIADFGTSDGGNSVPLFQSIIGLLKDLSFTGELTLIFNDLPGNNYNVLEKKVRSLERECMHVYLLMNACDMYKRCLPRNTLDIGLSTFTLQLLSKASVENGVGWNTASEAERNAMAKEAAEQWKLFLSQRCEEMTIGGFLIIRFVNLEQLRKAVENAFVDIYKDGWITQEEFRNINVPFYYMDKKEILEPFEYKIFRTEYETCGCPHFRNSSINQERCFRITVQTVDEK